MPIMCFYKLNGINLIRANKEMTMPKTFSGLFCIFFFDMLKQD